MEFGIPHLFAWLIAAIHGLGVLAAIHAVLTVRTAQGALAWGLSLFFMPYLTLLPYLVLGRSRFDAYVKARRQADAEMRQAMTAQDWRPWVEEALAEACEHVPFWVRPVAARPTSVRVILTRAGVRETEAQLSCETGYLLNIRSIAPGSSVTA